MRKSYSTRPAVLAGAAVLLAAGSALAAQKSTTFQVQANVPDVCQIQLSGATMDFGNYDPFAAADATAQLDVQIECTPGTGYDVGLDDGLVGTRLVQNAGADTLTYDFYTTAGGATRWGNTPGVDTQGNASYNPVVGPDVYTIYGRMATGQTVNSTGLYTDTVTATVFY